MDLGQTEQDEIKLAEGHGFELLRDKRANFRYNHMEPQAIEQTQNEQIKLAKKEGFKFGTGSTSDFHYSYQEPLEIRTNSQDHIAIAHSKGFNFDRGSSGNWEYERAQKVHFPQTENNVIDIHGFKIKHVPIYKKVVPPTIIGVKAHPNSPS